MNGKEYPIQKRKDKIINKSINTRPRQMENGDWTIPYSVQFEIAKISNFNSFDCTVDVQMKMCFRFKFTELPE